MAEIFRSNTNLQLPYRIPIIKSTHDRDCKRSNCIQKIPLRSLCILTQKVMKQMAGYFGGYISKRQKVGQFELKNSIAALPLYQQKLQEKSLKSAGGQLAHVCNKMFTTLEGKGILRTAPEEFMLASEYRPDDELAAEFLRTFRHRFFFGAKYVERFDNIAKAKNVTVNTILRGMKKDNHETDDVSCYSFRGTDARVYFLSPWEFTQYWKPVRVKSPRKGYVITRWAQDADKDNPVPGHDFVFTDMVLKHPDVVTFEAIAEVQNFETFRHMWMLLRRTRPVIPCPENTPLPSRKCTKEQRAKLLSVYLRPWTLVRQHASVHVPFLKDLRLTRVEWELRYTKGAKVDSEVAVGVSDETLTQEEPALRNPSKDLEDANGDAVVAVAKDKPQEQQKRIRVDEKKKDAAKCSILDADDAPGEASMKSDAHAAQERVDSEDACRASDETDRKEESTMRHAWKDYLTRVPPASARQIRNFMLAVMAEGRNQDRDDTAADGEAKMAPLTCKLDVDDVDELLQRHSSTTQHLSEDYAGADDTQRMLNRKLEEATQAASRMNQKNQRDTASHSAQLTDMAIARHTPLSEYVDKAAEEALPPEFLRTAGVDLYRSDWQEAYEAWREKLLSHPEKKPYDQQWQILDMVHSRCVLEETESARPNAPRESLQEPLFKLVHGLPGSGKSQLLEWLTDYFQSVWQWHVGIHFMKVAPMNSMAANIGGATMHSWGEIAFVDKKGNFIKAHTGEEKDVTNMSIKCSSLRWLLIDEIEAAGTEVLEEVEAHVSAGVPNKSRYKRRSRKDGDWLTPRPFGGVNTLLFGDFWQIPPVGQISIMGNPYSEGALSSASATDMLNMFWHAKSARNPNALQPWDGSPSRVMDLRTNKRSGGDQWFSDMLDSCRKGRLSANNYCFIHGYPTNVCGSWLEETQMSICGEETCKLFAGRTHELLHKDPRAWRERWQEALKLECRACNQERARRKRIIDFKEDDSLNEATSAFQQPGFAESIYITEFNKPVYAYALGRARIFARVSGKQLLWIQAEDRPPFAYFGDRNKKELEDLKRRWLQIGYHAKKTEGIMSLLPIAEDMPFRITCGHGKNFKKYGIHNGARCRARGWELHEVDVARLKDNSDQEVVLTHLPPRIYVEMEGNDTLQFENLPKKWFPIEPLVNSWWLDKDENIEIPRRGFPMVPDFSSTIHAATGRTLASAIGDLGGVSDKPSQAAAMRGYITISRVKSAGGLLLVQPFSPKLFNQGPQPFPTLLLQTLKGDVPEEELAVRCALIEENQKELRSRSSPLLLKNMFWTCCRCLQTLPAYKYIGGDADISRWTRDYQITILSPGCYRSCKACTKTRVAGGLSISLRTTYICSGCKADVPVDDLDEDVVKNTQRHASRDAKCNDCRKKDAVTSPILSRKTYTCSACHETLPIESFDKDVVENSQCHASRDAKCSDCRQKGPTVSIPAYVAESTL